MIKEYFRLAAFFLLVFPFYVIAGQACSVDLNEDKIQDYLIEIDQTVTVFLSVSSTNTRLLYRRVWNGPVYLECRFSKRVEGSKTVYGNNFPVVKNKSAMFIGNPEGSEFMLYIGSDGILDSLWTAD